MASSTFSAIPCPTANVKTRKGLDFSLYCNTDQIGFGDIGYFGTDNVEECMNLCASNPDQLCGAAVFYSDGLRCYLKDSNVTATSGVIYKDTATLGIANRTQIQPIQQTCSNNGGNQTTSNGLTFQIYCGQTIINQDSCSDDAPDCRTHTESLADCLDFCSKSRPLCTAAGWDATQQYGFQNCYPKNLTAHAFDQLRHSATNTIMAKALLKTGGADDCDAAGSGNGTIKASNNENFQISCGQYRSGNNITAQHCDTLGGCIDSCVNYTQPLCVGAIFDSDMGQGYENCHLMSSITDTIINQTTFTFVSRGNGNNRSSHNSTSTSLHKGRKAWIAAPVLGAVLIVVVAATWLWWKKKKQASSIREQEGLEPTTLGQRETGQRAEVEAWQASELPPAVIGPLHQELGTQGGIRKAYEME